MSNNLITMFVALSEEELLMERELIIEEQKVDDEISIAESQNRPTNDLFKKKYEIYFKLRDLRGVGNKGERLPKNSSELARSILDKIEARRVLEVGFINTQLESHQNEIKLIEERIEKIISVVIEINWVKGLMIFGVQ